MPARSEATRRCVKYVSLVDLFRVFVLRMNMPQACRARRRRVNGVREILWHYRENPVPNPCDINWLAKFVAKYDRDSAKDGVGDDGTSAGGRGIVLRSL